MTAYPKSAVVFALLSIYSFAPAEIDSGGGKSSGGAVFNHGSIGGSFATSITQAGPVTNHPGLIEVIYPITPASITDVNGNGLPDGWEVSNFGPIGVDPASDADLDGTSNLMEYLAGSDPTRADATDSALSIHSVADGFELRWTSIRALTDVRVGLEESAGLLEWRASSVGNGEKREWLPNGEIRRSYHFGPDPAARSRFFRMRPELLPTP